MTEKEQENITLNVEKVMESVGKAAVRSGRTLDDIKIIAVTKTIEIERMKKAFDTGLRDFGENRVQELCEKYDKFSRGIDWHLIGHLQKNKVKYIIDKVSLIHSLDSIGLAEEIQKRAQSLNLLCQVLVQVNVAGEESKFGIKPSEVYGMLCALSRFENIKVKGLMTVAPYTEDPESVRWVFRGLRKIFVDMAKENIDNIDMDYLSMGMSNDYSIAVEEGSNIVRIGTAIFGKRDKF